MKKTFTIITLLFCSFYLQSQNLTINELAALRKKSFGNVEEILSNKNWTFIQGDQPISEKLGSAVFAYNKEEYTDKSKAFLDFLYNNTEDNSICEHRIVLQFFDKTKYNSYINSFKTYGCKLIKSIIEDGNIVKVYQGETTTFKVTIITTKNEMEVTNTIYKFFILGNLDYSLYFE